MMNFQGLKVRGVQSFARQKQVTSIRQDNALEMLQAEAEKVRKWQVQMELNLKEKEKEVVTLNKTIDSLQKSVLECKMDKDNVERKLEEEMKSRESTIKRLESTRQMCLLLKDEFSRIEDTLALCEKVSDSFREDNEKKKMIIQKLTDDFVAMEAAMKETMDIRERKHSELVQSTQRQVQEATAARDESNLQLQVLKNNMAEKDKLLCDIEHKLSQSEGDVQKLKVLRGQLQLTMKQLLSVIGEMKASHCESDCLHALKIHIQKSKDGTITELESQLNLASEIIAEKTQLAQNLHEQYEFSKQTWHAAEEDFQATAKEASFEKEALSIKLEEAITERTNLQAMLENAVAKWQSLEEKVASLESRLGEAASKDSNQEYTIDDLRKQLQNATEENELYKAKSETLLKEKFEEYQELVRTKDSIQTELHIIRNEIKERTVELKEKSDLLLEKTEETEKLREENEHKSKELENFKAKTAEDLDQLQSELAKKKKKLASETEKNKKIAEDCKRWEKNFKEIEATLRKAEEKTNADEESIRKQMKSKENIIDTLKEELRSMSLKVDEEMKASLEARTDWKNKTETLEKEKTELRTELAKRDNTLSQLKDEINFLRQHMKDTEKLLSDEGDKIVRKNDLIEKYKKNVEDLEDEVAKRDKNIGNLETQLEEKTNQIKQMDTALKKQKIMSPECSFSPSRFRRRKTPRQAELKFKDQPEKPAVEVKKDVVKCNIHDLFSTTAEELLSEVSFGSAIMDAETFNRKTALKSSTPKVQIHGPNKTAQKVQKPSKRIPKKLQTRKRVKKEHGPTNWWDTDSVYGFNE